MRPPAEGVVLKGCNQSTLREKTGQYGKSCARVRAPGHRHLAEVTGVVIETAMSRLIESPQNSSTQLRSVLGRTHHAHRKSCRAPDLQFTHEPILPRSSSVVSHSTAGRHTGALVSPWWKRRHLLGCSWGQATDHPETGTVLTGREYLVRGIARCDHSIRNPQTTQSAHARAAAPSFR